MTQLTPLRLACIALVCAMLVGCEGCKSPAKANDEARQAKLESIRPRLETVAREHPDVADEVRQVLDGWHSGPERSIFERSRALLLDRYVVDHPDDAEAVRHALNTWQMRLDRFEPAAAAAPVDDRPTSREPAPALP